MRGYSRACYFGKAPFKGILDIDVDVDVGIDLYFKLFKGGLKVSAGTAEWYISMIYGTDFDTSETARPM